MLLVNGLFKASFSRPDVIKCLSLLDFYIKKLIKMILLQ